MSLKSLSQELVGRVAMFGVDSAPSGAAPMPAAKPQALPSASKPNTDYDQESF